ncbi:MAG: MBL fold metallo-hydrolase [Gemmatimonadota bacterium]|nr:MBL fold metallo-hydrolase [Gemmatimonadota bacterium]
MSAHREVLPGIHWIQECGPDRPKIARSVVAAGASWCTPGRPLHVPQNAYLLVGERSLLFDTLSPAAADLVVAAVEEILGDRPLDYVALSHTDVPHAANAARLLRRYPDARLVGPAAGETHALYHLDGALLVGPDDEIDLGGLVVRFPEATFLDAALHTWMSEETTKTLFTVDWLGFPHVEGECLKCVDELAGPIDVSRLEAFHSRVMFWFQYVEVAKVVAATERLAREFAGYRLFPSHGLPIRESPDRFFHLMNEVVANVAATGRTGVL